jgi:hypothetical protein
MRFTLEGFDFRLDGQRVGVLTGTRADRMKLEDYLETLVEDDKAFEADVYKAVKLIEEIIDDVAEDNEGHADRLELALRSLNKW